MNRVVPFEYGAFRDHYSGLGDVANDVFVRIYTADYRAMKFATATPGAVTAEMRPFLHRGMTARVLPTDDPLRRLPMFRFGAYIVHPIQEDKKKQQLFVVSPWEHGDDTHGTYFTADHFSFVVNPSANAGRRLNFHRTVYVPDNIVRGEGLATHAFNPLPTSFALPTSADALARSGLFSAHVPREYAEVLVAMLSRPFTVGPIEGGAAGRKKRRARRRVVAAARARRAAGRGERQFDDLWRELPVHSLLVFGLPGPGDSISVTVFVTDRFKYSSAPQRSAVAFTVSEDVIQDDATLEARIAEALASLSWDGMWQQSVGVDDDDA